MLGLVALIVTSTIVVNLLTPDTRFAYGVAPLARDQAVLLTRRNEDDATYFWVERVGSDGSVAWTTELSPIEAADALGFSGVAATDTQVLLLGERRGLTTGDTVVMSLSRDSGSREWEITVADTPPRRIGPMLIVDPPRLYVIHERVLDAERREDAITALALADGKLLWRLEPPADAPLVMQREVALRGPGRLLTTSPTGLVELDGATGATREAFPFNWLRCGTPMGIVASDGRKLAFLPRVAETGGDHGADARTLELDPGWRDAIEGPCGMRGDDLVVGTMHTSGGIGLTRLDPTTGATRWLLDLGPWLYDLGTTANGRLPRFVPLVVFGTQVQGGLMENQVVVVDLDQGTIVDRHPVRDHMRPLVTADRAYVMGLFIGTLFALDPATGKLARATHLGGLDTSDFRAEDYRFGTLWLTGTGWGGPADLAWLVFDLETGSPVRVNGKVTLEDVTASGWSARR